MGGMFEPQRSIRDGMTGSETDGTKLSLLLPPDREQVPGVLLRLLTSVPLEAAA